MKKTLLKPELWLLIITIIAGIVLAFLYQSELLPVEQPPALTENDTLDWTIENSLVNGAPLREDKGIYPDEPDPSIHDVYISVFPTKDADGKMLEFSDFSKHTARDHTYNPVLKCNVQILNEGQKLDPLTDTDASNATIRVRGNSSRGATYKSYKIKMDDKTPVLEGQSTLNLNKHGQDIHKIITKLCTDLLTDIDDITSYRTYFMRVWIRDASLPQDEQEYKYYGLYTHIEQPNNSYLETRGLGTGGEMYKARNFTFAMVNQLKNVDDPDYSQAAFEEILPIREGNNHTELLNMLAAVNDYGRDFSETFATYFNEENYLTWLAFNLIMGGDDIINHNFIIYRPGNSKTWYFIPWDFDANLQSEEGRFARSLSGGQKLNSVILHKRYFRQPGSIQKIQAKMDELMQKHLSKENIRYHTDLYRPVLEKTLPLYPDIERIGNSTPSEVIANLDNLYSMAEYRYNLFTETFNLPAPMYVAAPERSESKLKLAWEPSYSYQGRPIHYRVRLYDTYSKEKLLYEEDNILSTSCIADVNLDPGTYYLEVMAIDSDGGEQYSLEHYEFSGVERVFVNGLLEFTLK